MTRTHRLLTRLASLVAATGVVVATWSVPASAGPTSDWVPSPADRAAARGVVVPGSFTGYGFDTCRAPSQRVMDTWRRSSPYSAVGIYIGGSNRLCDQPELDAAWVRTQVKRGWRLLPVQVGPQASCSGYAHRMSSDRATAEQQGRAEARTAVRTARSLAIARGSTLYYDLEDYDLGPDDCRRAALSFLSGWTQQLHVLGFDSGVYSSLGAAITSLDYADRVSPGSYTMPDDIWFAWDNGRADTRTDSRVLGSRWDDHARIHQYRLDVVRRYGGVAMQIDENWLDVGRGSTASRGKPVCRGVRVDLRRYPRLARGARGPAVAAAQCLLRDQRFGKVRSGRFDARTVKAVRQAQRRLDQKVTGTLTRRTWVALLANGPRPMLKVGATGEPVRRVQRALGLTLGRRVRVDGLLSTRTSRAVLAFQRRERLPRTGTVGPETWNRLISGG